MKKNYQRPHMCVVKIKYKQHILVGSEIVDPSKPSGDETVSYP